MDRKQFIISKKNIARYLKSRNTNLEISEVGQIKEIIKNSGSCFIFKVKIKVNNKWRSVIIKQARDFLKINPSFKLSPKRLEWEYEALKFFTLAGNKKVLPEVLWYDDENYILALSDVRGDTGKLLREEIKKGKPHPEIMKDFAELLAEWHLFSYNKNIGFSVKSDKRFSKKWSSFLKNESINNFYTIGARKVAVNSIVNELLEESRQSPSAMIWLDPLAKNIFTDKGKFKLIDFETAVNWDIAWDAALFISDWVIELAGVNKKTVAEAKKCVSLFLTAYIKKISARMAKAELLAVEKRIYRYLGVFLLHRTNGVDNYKFKKSTYFRIQTEALRLLQGLYANDFAKSLITLLNIDNDFIQDEISFKSGKYKLNGILQTPKIKSNKKIPVVIYLHGGTDRGMLGSPAIFEISNILLKQGIAVFRFNFIGTDNSDGLLCDKTWDKFEDNFQQAVNLIKRDRRFSKIGAVGRSFGATLIAANADSQGIQAMVLHNPIFDEWYEFIHLLPEMSKDFMNNPSKKFLILGIEKSEHIKGDYKFSSEIIKQFPMEKWKIMQALPKSNNICVIQAEKDPETTPEYAKILYNMARQPKAYHIIKNTTHKFPGKEKEAASITAKWLIACLKNNK